MQFSLLHNFNCPTTRSLLRNEFHGNLQAQVRCTTPPPTTPRRLLILREFLLGFLCCGAAYTIGTRTAMHFMYYVGCLHVGKKVGRLQIACDDYSLGAQCAQKCSCAAAIGETVHVCMCESVKFQETLQKQHSFLSGSWTVL